MKLALFLILSWTLSATVMAGPSCREQGQEKGLSDQSGKLNDFVTKCRRQVLYVCSTAANEKNLTGGNKGAFMKQCKKAEGY